MCLSRRLLYAVGCLGLGFVAQLALWLHVREAGEDSFPQLVQDLDRLTMELPAAVLDAKVSPGTPALWRGRPDKGIAALREQVKSLDPDQVFLRTYTTDHFAYPLSLYMIYCRDGEDRKHHPEICIREVAGAPEDLRARQVVFLDDEQQRPVQRFRFQTGTSQYLTVYYWHYTFVPPVRDGETLLQAIHRRLSRPSPSITVQISTPAPLEALAKIEESFLPALDAALRKDHLPPRTLVGCERLAIEFVRQ